MRCRHARRLCLRSVDVPLDPERARTLESHLAACPACRRLLRRAELVRASLAGGDVPEPLPYFRERLRARIAEPRRPEPIVLWLRWSIRAVPVSLLLIGFFAGAIAFLSPAVNEEISQPEALLLQNVNPLSETITLLDDKVEDRSLRVIFAVNERSGARRYGP
jgi:anti-sigma factor RsiW